MNSSRFGLRSAAHPLRPADLVLIACALAAASASAQTPASAAYPARTVRVIVPYTPGGGNDLLARMVVARALTDLGGNAVVDNRPGGNTVIGTQLAARSAPDGHTLLTVDNAYTTAPSVQHKLPYDTLQDFVRVTMMAKTSPILVVHPSVPARSVQELVALAKARPGQLAYGSTGSGTTAHLAFAQIKHVAGIDAVHVPYKGGAPQVTALVSGEVSMLLAIPSGLLAHIQSGRMRPLAVSGATRLGALPELPTLRESGVNVVVESFWGVVAPAGTPAAVAAQLQGAIARALGYEEVRAKLRALQFQPVGTSPAEFESFVRSEVERWIGVVKATGAKVE
jgi:tripartite-type tricarboxylate transporter receptor subunit TctC